ncbi:hypothetical protein SAMN02799624_05373 [Paenibacillus sp. UNC496MF]|uniref:hypothetical protein n=1 Tax=Paenibacillus sp. UNC496MF TaxID=1502753 RepID=UPI0008EB0156|nr:hypothetical protein [Paenibacillus sp. UNC496MF]SFJ64964.1 hypothetical protein SAMN02799624_05373 [Paenibacillus sp. UNC496MF]
MELLQQYILELDVEKRHVFTHWEDEPPEGYYWVTIATLSHARQLIGRVIKTTLHRQYEPTAMDGVEPAGFTRSRPTGVEYTIELLLKSNREIDSFYMLTWGATFTLTINGTSYEDSRIIDQNVELLREENLIRATIDLNAANMKIYNRT